MVHWLDSTKPYTIGDRTGAQTIPCCLKTIVDMTMKQVSECWVSFFNPIQKSYEGDRTEA